MHSNAGLKCTPTARRIPHHVPARVGFNHFHALTHETEILPGESTARLLPIVTETMREVKEKVGLA